MKKVTTTVLMSLAVVLLVSTAQAQTLVSKWRNTAPGAQSNRGIAYNPVTQNLLVVTNATLGHVTRFSSVDGSAQGLLDTNGVLNSTLKLCGIAVDADGVIYASSYAAGGTTINIYKWTDESAAPTILWSGTYGATTERIGAILSVTGTGTNAKFIVAGNGTSASYVYYDGSAWTSKVLTCVNQTMTSGAQFVDFNNGGSAKWRIIAKTGQTGGYLYSFDPTAASPITLTQDKVYAAASGALSFGANGVHDIAYDPTTGLIGGCTRVMTASPFSYTNYVFSTIAPASIITPAQVSKEQPPNATQGDTGSVGGAAWGTNCTLYTSASANGAGLNAYYIAPYKVTDISPASQAAAIGSSAAFSVAAGGTKPLTYIWKHGSTVLSDDANHSGATTATLTINSVAVSDLGNYTCTVSNVTGSGSMWTSSAGALGLASTTALTSSSATTTYGDAVTFTATVSGSDTTPTGTVAFKDGATTIGNGTLDALGQATLITSALTASASPHSMTAVYSGNSTYLSSTSSVYTQTVNQKTLTAAVTVGSKVYNGNTTAAITGRSLTGVVAGDEAAVSLGTSGTTAFPSKNAGSYNLTITGLALSGTKAANYVLSPDPVMAPADITPLAVQVTGLTANSKPYDTTAIATLSGTAALTPPAIGGDLVTLDGTPVALFATPNVGTAKPVSVTGYTLSGLDSGNYNLSQPSGLAADITAVASTMLVTSSQNPSTNGVSVTFTAAVNSTAGTPTGDVVFLTNGVTMATVALSSGSASVSAADLPVGTTTVQAQYAAQANWLNSAGSVDQVVYSAVTYSTTNTLLSIVANGDGTYTLNCQGTPGAEYYVVATAILDPVSWTPVAGTTNVAPSPSGVWSCVVSNAAPAFYRSAAVHPAP